MAKMVYKYQTKDGRLFDSSAEAEAYEEEQEWRNSLSMLAHYTAGELPDEQLVDWLLAHREVLEEMLRYPRSKEEALAKHLRLEPKRERLVEDAYFENDHREAHPELYGKAPFTAFDGPAESAPF